MSSKFVNLIEARRNLCQLNDENLLVILESIIKKHNQKTLIVKSLFTQIYKDGHDQNTNFIEDILKEARELLTQQVQSATKVTVKDKQLESPFVQLPVDVLAVSASHLDIFSAHGCFAKLNKDCFVIVHGDYRLQSLCFDKQTFIELQQRLKKNPPKFKIKLAKLLKSTFSRYIEKHFYILSTR